MRNFIVLILLLAGFQATGQSYADSVALEDVLVTATEDTAYFEPDSVYAHLPRTQKPGELTVTQQERQKKYIPKKFNKTEWKKIIGEKNYEEEDSKQSLKMPTMAWDPALLKVIGYIVIFGLLTFLIFLFIKHAVNDSDRKVKAKQATLFTDENAPQDIAEEDLEKLLREALAQRELRVAVRLYYIKLLKHFNYLGYIRWGKNKTNRDYAAELAALGISREFRKLMIAYEYVWYGERTPSGDEFDQLQSHFESLLKTQRS